MAGYDLRIQGEDETDTAEGNAEAWNPVLQPPVGAGGNTTLRNNNEDDIVACSYEKTAIRAAGGSPYSQLVCDDSGLQGVYRETMGGGY